MLHLLKLRVALMKQPSFPILSHAELQDLGKGNVAYLRRYSVNGQPAFALHAADGAMLEVQDSELVTRESAWHKNLSLVTLH